MTSRRLPSETSWPSALLASPLERPARQADGKFQPSGAMKAVSLVLILCGAFASPPRFPAIAQAAAPASPTPTLEQRVAGLEAYIANTDPRAALRGPMASSLPASPWPPSASPAPAHNGWMMTAAALVLFMTLPGLALSYGGLVRRKNVLSVLAQCFGIAGLATILWWAVGYSLVFAPGRPWLGGLRYAMLNNVGSAPNPDYSFWVSQNVFAMFELMFAIITPAIIVGATAERMRFAAVLTFIGLWMFLVYFPVAHMMWGVDGAMNGLNNANAIVKAIDFAGGTVVHMTSGWSSLILCIMLGRRAGLREGEDAAAFHGPLHGRHRHALGRLVWLQCRQRPGRRRHRLERLPHHHPRRRGRLLRVGICRVDRHREIQRPRLLLRRDRRAGRRRPVAAATSMPPAPSSSAWSAASCPTSPSSSSRPSSAMTTRSMPLAFTPSAAPSACLLAGFLARVGRQSAPRPPSRRLASGKTLWIEQLKAIFIVHGRLSRRHPRRRAHRPALHRLAPTREAESMGSTSPNTARKVTSSDTPII